MRAKPGVSIDRLRTEMAAVMAGLARDFPSNDKERLYTVRPLIESIVGDLGPILIIVFAATGVLLLACVNVTNLLLARGVSRSREIAVRLALGAGRQRILRQLLTESMVLSAIGATFGLLFADVFVRLLLNLGASHLPRLNTVSFDGRVLLFALAMLLFCGTLVGLAPALQLARRDINPLINDGTRFSSAGQSTRHWHGLLTIIEIALAVALVGGAGWLVRSFNDLSTTNPGFETQGRYLFTINLNGPTFKDKTVAFNSLTQLLDGIRHLNGITSAGATRDFPLSGTDNALGVHLPGDPMDASHILGSRQRVVSPGFFSTMGIELLTGRDRLNTTPVVIVNRTFVNRYLTGRDSLTTQFYSGTPEIDVKTPLTIIGVVDDVRNRSLSEPPEPAYYSVWSQGTPTRNTFVVRTEGVDLPSLRSALGEEVRKVDPRIPVDIEPVADLVSQTITRQQLAMTLMLMFAGTALALAAVGVYGVIAYSVAQRQREAAIRVALGATPNELFSLVLKRGVTLAISGTLLGLVIAYFTGRIMSHAFYDVRSTDPLVLGAAAAIVLTTALAATLTPAYRIAHLEVTEVSST